MDGLSSDFMERKFEFDERIGGLLEARQEQVNFENQKLLLTGATKRYLCFAKRNNNNKKTDGRTDSANKVICRSRIRA